MAVSLLIINWRRQHPFTFDRSIEKSHPSVRPSFPGKIAPCKRKKIPSISDPSVEQGSRNAAWLAARTPPLRPSSRRKITFESSAPKNVSGAVC